MSKLHHGGCHCGAMRYQVTAALHDVAHCHCSICRRTTGGIVTTWATVPLPAFAWTAGTPAQYASSDTCIRYFCPTCSAQLALFTHLSPESMDITIATLDAPEQVQPDRHIWVTTRLPWLHLDEQLPAQDGEELG